MALQLLGKDPASEGGGSPTLYYDSEQDTYVIQGWKVVDQGRLDQMEIPENETVIELPRRMVQFFPEVSG